MKLYTEEQVMDIILDSFISEYPTNANDILSNYTPIELPSDDEIIDQGKLVFNDAGYTIFNHYNTVPSWVEGAKWIRDKIKLQQ